MKMKINIKLARLSATDGGDTYYRPPKVPSLKWALVINGIKCCRVKQENSICAVTKKWHGQNRSSEIFYNGKPHMATKIVHITLTFDWGRKLHFTFKCSQSRNVFIFVPQTKRDLRTCCYLCKKFCADTAAYKRGVDCEGGWRPVG